VKRIGIKHNNQGSNVLGMEHVAEVGASVSWEPGAAQGTLTV
jgi:hypothetical protein